MKHILLFASLFIMLLSAKSAEKYPKEIERPEHGLKSTSLIEIGKVLLTDSETILYIDVYSRSNVRINIDSSSYLLADGKKYEILSTGGIKLNENFPIRQNEVTHFTLIFKPLPEGTKSFDFIEGDHDNCYKIWDVNITDKKQDYQPNIPSDILNLRVDKTVRFPNPEFKIGKTKVSLHITGLREGYPLNRVLLVMNNIFTGTSDEIEPQKISNEEYVFEVEQYATSSAFLQVGSIFTPLLLNPGENADVYIDMTARAKNKSRYNPLKDLPYIIFKSEFKDINNQLIDVNEARVDLQLVNIYDSLIVDMTKNQYLDNILGMYNKILIEIDNSTLNSVQKQYLKSSLKSNTTQAIIRIDYIFTSSYRTKHKLDKKAAIDYEAPKLEENDMLRLKDMGLNDSTWIYSQPYSYIINTMTNCIPENTLNDIVGTKTSLINDLYKCLPIIKKAVSMQNLTSEEETKLASVSNPYYGEVYGYIYESVKKQYDRNMAKGGFIVEDTPQTSEEQILDAIVAKYKGKVVFVDFWATWCGPCLNSMKKMKEIKPEIAKKDIVIIYITNATSPKTKWTSMLPEIGGIHYYLNEKQWEILGKKHGFKGIPTYMIFDKSGNKTFQKSGYPGNENVIEELSKVW